MFLLIFIYLIVNLDEMLIFVTGKLEKFIYH